jgi:hypothetical protein
MKEWQGNVAQGSTALLDWWTNWLPKGGDGYTGSLTWTLNGKNPNSVFKTNCHSLTSTFNLIQHSEIIIMQPSEHYYSVNYNENQADYNDPIHRRATTYYYRLQCLN